MAPLPVLLHGERRHCACCRRRRAARGGAPAHIAGRTGPSRRPASRTAGQAPAARRDGGRAAVMGVRDERGGTGAGSGVRRCAGRSREMGRLGVIGG